MIKISSHSKIRGSVTVIELMEGVAAIVLATWIAGKVSGQVDDQWKSLVFWSIRIGGSGLLFLCFLYGFSYLFDRLEKRGKGKLSR